MTSGPHSLGTRAFRPDPGDYDNAMSDLRERERQMEAFFGACLRWLHDDPDRALEALAPHWPPPRRRGRPPRQPDVSSTP